MFRSLFPGGQRADVVIVGGGILGLSTAVHAARFGVAVQVLEAGEIGQGASGLNGGQVIPGLKYDPEWLLEHFGLERGEILVNFAASTADAVFELIRDEKLAVPFVRNGWIQAAHTETALERRRTGTGSGGTVAPMSGF
ncbi:FAD-dependent oxidoreductase [Mesorhizobium sp.]|uniref:NAD(P)/FAD-dependent oxidoreductase n=1 Tax=Mesorhizobium sp. TaxID=1871066 RepID=UPI00339073D8